MPRRSDFLISATSTFIVVLFVAQNLLAVHAQVLNPVGSVIDYSQDTYWASLPTKKDNADGPIANYADGQATANVSTFWVHGTTYHNADVLGYNEDPMAMLVNNLTNLRLADDASMFNGKTKIFAPFYRQMSREALNDEINGPNAQAIAYADVLAAFDEFIAKRWNGFSIVLGGNDQGANLLLKLIHDRFDCDTEQCVTLRTTKLIAAYLIGELVGPDAITNIPICTTDGTIRCWVSWNTASDTADVDEPCGHAMSSGCAPFTYNSRETPVCVNPLSWEIGPHMDEEEKYGNEGSKTQAAYVRQRSAAKASQVVSRALYGEVYTGAIAVNLVNANCMDDGINRIIDDEVHSWPHDDDDDSDLTGDYQASNTLLYWVNVRNNIELRVANTGSALTNWLSILLTFLA